MNGSANKTNPSPLPKTSLSVGAVAKRCGINISALHFYESKGLIRSTRNAGNQRRYDRAVIRQISIIKAAQKMGISLTEIQTQFNALPNHRTPTQKDWEKMARRWQAQLNQRIANLARLRDFMSGCIGCGCLSMRACPLYNEDDKLACNGPGPVILEAE